MLFRGMVVRRDRVIARDGQSGYSIIDRIMKMNMG